MPTNREEEQLLAQQSRQVESDQAKLDFICRYFKTSIAISAVHTWVLTALALVPTNVLILLSVSAP